MLILFGMPAGGCCGGCCGCWGCCGGCCCCCCCGGCCCCGNCCGPGGPMLFRSGTGIRTKTMPINFPLEWVKMTPRGGSLVPGLKIMVAICRDASMPYRQCRVGTHIFLLVQVTDQEVKIGMILDRTILHRPELTKWEPIVQRLFLQHRCFAGRSPCSNLDPLGPFVRLTMAAVSLCISASFFKLTIHRD